MKGFFKIVMCFGILTTNTGFTMLSQQAQDDSNFFPTGLNLSDSSCYENLMELYAQKDSYRLTLLGNQYMEENSYSNAAMAYLLSITIMPNYDLDCFLKRKGFDYAGQAIKPNPDNQKEFRDAVAFLAKRLSE